jgi:hypothetical protein
MISLRSGADELGDEASSVHVRDPELNTLKRSSVTLDATQHDGTMQCMHTCMCDGTMQCKHALLGGNSFRVGHMLGIAARRTTPYHAVPRRTTPYHAVPRRSTPYHRSQPCAAVPHQAPFPRSCARPHRHAAGGA